MNHRFLDLKLRGAPMDAPIEDKLRQKIRGTVTRGSLSVSVRTVSRGSQAGVKIDRAAARRAHSELKGLADQLGLGHVSLSTVLSQPGVVLSADNGDESAQMGEAILEAADEALAQLVEMRESEGSALEADMNQRIDTLAGLAAELKELAVVTPAEAQQRLTDRLERLLQNSKVSVDESRLAQEVAILADRLDVTEELVRVASHLEQVRKLMAKKGPVGRKLDFLVQELGREFNTVTSKSQSATVARLVVDAKAEMEKIREQVQNIE